MPVDSGDGTLAGNIPTTILLVRLAKPARGIARTYGFAASLPNAPLSQKIWRLSSADISRVTRAISKANGFATAITPPTYRAC